MKILLGLISSIVRFINVSTWMPTNHTSVKMEWAAALSQGIPNSKLRREETGEDQETDTKGIYLRNCLGRFSKPSFSTTETENLFVIIQYKRIWM